MFLIFACLADSREFKPYVLIDKSQMLAVELYTRDGVLYANNTIKKLPTGTDLLYKKKLSQKEIDSFFNGLNEHD